MNLNEVLEAKKQILEKAKELGFSDSVKIYNGPEDILYLIVESMADNANTIFQRCAGLKCEMTDLLACQVMIINSSQISQENEHEFSKKSALLTDYHDLQKAFVTDDLTEIEIDAINPQYECDMEDFRDVYESFKKESSVRPKENLTEAMSSKLRV
jgi:hypothetical protein